MREKIRELFGVDLRALAALRIGLALLVLVDLALRAGDLKVFYTEEGVLPAELARRVAEPGACSLHFAANATGAALVFALHVAVAALLLVGWQTRFAAVACWLLSVSLHHRNPHVEQGADEVLRVVLFWAMLLPLGSRWSIDGRAKPPAPRGPFVSVASAALLLQIAAVYWFGFLFKKGLVWSSGEAAWHALSHDHVGRLWAQRVFLPHPELCAMFGRGVLWAELFAPTLLFVPWRTARFRVAGVAALVVLQLGFGLTLHVAHFPWVSALVLVVFLPRSTFDALERALGSPAARAEGEAPRSRFVEVLAGVSLAYVTAWLVVGLARAGDAPLGTTASFPGTFLGLDQRWTMFAPPARDSGWLVFPGALADKTEVDAFPTLREEDVVTPVRWDKPADVFATYRNTRWMDYLDVLYGENDAFLWSGLGSWVCSRWNATHHDARRLERFTVTYVLEETTPPGRPRTRQRQPRYEHTCAR